MRYFVFLLVLLTACTFKKAQENDQLPNEDKIVFLVFKASRDASLANTQVQLIKKIETTGIIKKSEKRSEPGANYLKFVFYEDGYFYDSIKIEHPLFKHFEYLDEANKFAVKDTMVLESEFFHRFQLRNRKYVMQIFEIVNNQAPYAIKAFDL